MVRSLDGAVAWVVLVAGLLLAVMVGIAEVQDHRRLDEARMDFHVAQRTQAIQEEFRRTLRVVHVVALLMDVTEPDEDTFRAFATPLVERDAQLRALGVNLIVPRAERAAFEAERATRYPGFQITERGSAGLTRASDRPEYIAVWTIAPLQGNEAALGFDIASEPVRAAALRIVRQTGRPTITGPIELVQEDRGGLGFLAFERVSSQVIATGVFRIPDILEASLTSLEPVDVDVWVTDVTDSPIPLYRWSGSGRTLHSPAPAPDGARETEVQAGGRIWRLEFAQVRRRTVLTMPPIGGGLVIAAISALVFVLIRDRERKRAVSKAAADRLELILDTVANGVWDWSISTERVVLSHSWLGGLGYSLVDVPKDLEFWMGTLHRDDRAAWSAALEVHLRGDTAIFRARARRRAADGEYRWYEDRGRVVERDARGAAVRMLGVGTDVEADIARDAADRREQERRTEAHRMESLGLLAGGVAHDFNNLLTPILGSVHELIDAMPHGSEGRAAAENIRIAAIHASSLTRQMLDYVGRSGLQLAVVDPGRAVREVEALLRATIPRRLALEVDVQDDLPAVDGDLSQLKQVVLNLVTNAAEVQPESGLVAVRVFSGPPDDTPVLGTMPVGVGVCVEVRDHGPGLASDPGVLFDPFYTTRERGRGLGLSVVQGVVTAHRGAVAVRTSAEGTAFRVWLPVSENTPAPATPRPESADVPAGPRRVLLVDDDALVRRSVRRALERAGHLVVEAEDGLEAIAAAESDRYDVVLLDVEMPRMGGITALPRIAEHLPDALIVICTGYSEQRLEEAMSADPRLVHLPKPFEMPALLALIDAHGET